MLVIAKRHEPPELLEYRLTSDASYDGPDFTPIKDAIRRQLLDEQGHLCAYCMGRIKRESMKIEHWRPQSSHPKLQLAYPNLLGVCKGNEGQAPENQHCDTRKGNRLISYNPADTGHRIEDKVRHLGNGTIQGTETVFDTDLDGTLNLNLRRLRENRISVINAVRQVLADRPGPGTRTKAHIEKYLSLWQGPVENGKRQPYAGVAIYWLKKRLNHGHQPTS